MELNYDELTRDPEASLKQVCAFLELTYESNMLVPKVMRWQANANEKRIVSHSERWRSYFNPKQLAQLEVIAGSTLNQFGFETNNPTSSVDPNPVLLWYWAQKDNLWQVVDLLRSRKQARKKGYKASWSAVGAQIKAAIIAKGKNTP